MSVYQLARELDRAENAILAALARKGDRQWRWHGTKANPHTVPLIWNQIEVTQADGSTRTVAAIDYVQEA
jgi:hypothetical protein